MKQLLLELIENRPLAPGMILHTYRGPEVASQARAGQFVNIRVSGGTDPLLRRPFSICTVDPDAGTFTVLIKIVGAGTRLLGELSPGSKVDMLAPLGTHFQWEGPTRLLLVGGGVGVAPMLLLAQEVRRKTPPPQPEIVFCYGARTAEEFVLLDWIEPLTNRLELATNDGSRGQKGLVTEIAQRFFTPETAVFTCGPNPMMDDLLTRMRQVGLEGQASLENRMGCGIGACQGCVVPTRKGYLRICCDGPVLPTSLLDSIRL